MTDNAEAVLESGGKRLDPVRGRVHSEVERSVSVRCDLVDVGHRGQGRDHLEVAGQARAVEDGVVVGQDGLVDVHVVVVDQCEHQGRVGGMFAVVRGGKIIDTWE